MPGTGVSAVVFNLTAIAPRRTVLTAFTGGADAPAHRTLNVKAHAAVSNRVIVPVTCSGGNCTVSIWNGAGSINIAVDIDGWFSATGKSFTALGAPVRVCDTQYGNPSVQGCTQGAVQVAQQTCATSSSLASTASRARNGNRRQRDCGQRDNVDLRDRLPRAGWSNSSQRLGHQPDAVLRCRTWSSSAWAPMAASISSTPSGSVNLIVDVLGYYS